MKLYRVDKFSKKIKETESERQTDASVFINGNRSNWKTEWTNYYKTYDEAKNDLINRYTQSVSSLSYKLETAKSDLEYVNNLKNV